ncbi:MAG: hypothetical protein AB7O59_16545 [Pirellulales bacterium]
MNSARGSIRIVRRAIVRCTVAAVALCALPAAADELRPADEAGKIRRLESQHLTLYTDLPAGPEVDALPGLFDQAFDQWCAYFDIDPKEHAEWRVRGHLMQSRERFEAAGFVPAEVPDFTSGFALGDRLWCYDQTSEYYRRHLLLHEGTHAFMQTLVGGVGPPWYAEGMAELLATHRLADGRLTLDYFPRTRDEVSKWGRIEIVGSDFAARRAKTLDKVFAFSPPRDAENEWYGWCWAAAAFFDGHPRYRDRFRAARQLIDRPDFNAELRRAFGDDWPQVQEDWQLFVANLDYGYDFERMDLDRTPGTPLPAGGGRARVAADRGWQASGVRLQSGKKYRLHASGRYQVASAPRVWWCEPGGVTIRYYHAQPLGILLAAVRADGDDAGTSGLVRPAVVGRETVFTAPRDGNLYFRVNDSAGSLGDNAGSLEVEIVPE